MTVIDLTCPMKNSTRSMNIAEELVPLQSSATRYTGVIYTFTLDSMLGSYIDFPGHIRETDNGEYADTVNPLDFYRMRAKVLHLDRADGSGPVTGDDLEKACGGNSNAPALVINALGAREPYEIARRSVYLDDSAVEWIIGTKCRLLVSDIYESTALHGVFLKLFAHGISTVCEPVRLIGLTAPEVLLTATFLPIPGATQLSCRLIAEFE